MAQDNQISALLTPAEYDAIRAAMDIIRQKLPFLVNLTDAERQVYAKMGDKTVAFVTKALEYAKYNPHLVPPYLNVAEFAKDMELIVQLRNILRPLLSLTEGLDDTLMLAGSESYAAALTFYNSVKMASKMNIAGTTAIYNDLKVRFPGRGPLRPGEEVTEEESTAPTNGTVLTEL